MADFTYRPPEERAFLATLREYLRTTGRRDLNDLLEGASLAFETAGRFSRVRWDGFAAEVRLTVPMSRIARFTNRSKEELRELVHTLMPAEVGYDFTDIHVVPLMESTEVPADESVEAAIQALDWEHVKTAWAKASSLREHDPDAAITAARSLLETVCKHILQAAGIPFDPGASLPSIYKAAARELKLSPSEQQEPILRQICQGCQTVVEGVGALRNEFGDAHGKAMRSVSPTRRHAELAVNMAGSLALFLVQSWQSRTDAGTVAMPSPEDADEEDIPF